MAVQYIFEIIGLHFLPVFWSFSTPLWSVYISVWSLNVSLRSFSTFLYLFFISLWNITTNCKDFIYLCGHWMFIFWKDFSLFLVVFAVSSVNFVDILHPLLSFYFSYWLFQNLFLIILCVFTVILISFVIISSFLVISWVFFHISCVSFCPSAYHGACLSVASSVCLVFSEGGVRPPPQCGQTSTGRKKPSAVDKPVCLRRPHRNSTDCRLTG